MPRNCLVCTSSEREAVEKAIVAKEPLRRIAARVGISQASLSRHAKHISQSIVKAAERREEQLGENLLEEMRRIRHKLWDLADKAEAEGDNRGAIVGVREVRECIESMGEMIEKASANGGELTQPFDLTVRFVSAGEPVDVGDPGNSVDAPSQSSAGKDGS